MQQETEQIAHDFGLDFPDVQFEVVDWNRMNQVLAYNGFPIRYPHWTFGMAYNRYRRGFDWRSFRVYELVINTDPCIAYLLASNELFAQKMVMLHVYGHAHFFKNNAWFKYTDRNMLNIMANHATLVRRFIDRYGLDKVEAFLDLLFSLDNLVDVHSVAICRRSEKERPDYSLSRLPAKRYMEGFINPPDKLKQQRDEIREKRDKESVPRDLPHQPEQDVLLFLLENAPLATWQQDLLDIVRQETYYFLPQGQTKILNEGFATFVHSRLMSEHACSADELIDYAKLHSGIVHASRGKLNPYRLGYQLLLDIEERWNRGMFGRDWENCTDLRERKEWDKGLGLGLKKVFEVVQVYNDIGFLDEFLTYEFAERQRLFTIDYYKPRNVYYISGREFDKIKRRLLFSKTNVGSPFIYVTHGNWKNRGELFLKHRYEGDALDEPFVQGTLRALYAIWKRPVHLKTVMHSFDEDSNGRVWVRYRHDKDGSHKILGENYKEGEEDEDI